MRQNFRKPMGGSFRSSSFQGSRSRRNFGRGRGRGGFQKSSRINESMFINKASENDHVLDYIAKHKFSDFKIEERLKQNISKKNSISQWPSRIKPFPRFYTVKI